MWAWMRSSAGGTKRLTGREVRISSFPLVRELHPEPTRPAAAERVLSFLEDVMTEAIKVTVEHVGRTTPQMILDAIACAMLRHHLAKIAETSQGPDDCPA